MTTFLHPASLMISASTLTRASCLIFNFLAIEDILTPLGKIQTEYTCGIDPKLKIGLVKEDFWLHFRWCTWAVIVNM